MGETKISPRDPRDLYMDRPLVIFDGVCLLCSTSVRFIIRRDPKGIFCFTALQGNLAPQMLADMDPVLGSGGSILLIDRGKVYAKSDAVLQICRKLAWPWSWLWVFRVIPKVGRDKIYDLVARNRYRWFGRRDTCMVPDPEWVNRFLP